MSCNDTSEAHDNDNDMDDILALIAEELGDEGDDYDAMLQGAVTVEVASIQAAARSAEQHRQRKESDLGPGGSLFPEDVPDSARRRLEVASRRQAEIRQVLARRDKYRAAVAPKSYRRSGLFIVPSLAITVFVVVLASVV